MDDVAAVRMILQGHDEGVLTAGEVSYRILLALLEPYVERAAKGQESGIATTWCGADESARRAIVEVGPGRIWFYPERR